MKDIELIILAGDCYRVASPLRIIVPFKLESSKDILLKGKINEKENIELVGHLDPVGKKEAELTLIVPDLNPKSELKLNCSNISNPRSTVSITKQKETVYDVKINDKYFTSLHFNEENLANRPYLYPLLTPKGIRTTRSLHYDPLENETKDHPHHTGCWTAWGDISGTDNWAYGKTKGRQEVKKINIEQNAVFGKFDLDIEWTTSHGKPQLIERRQIWFYNQPEYTNLRMVDFQIDLQPCEKEVKFKDTKEGGFLAVRVATFMDVPNGGKIENSVGGINEKMTWGKRAQWCDYCGVVDNNKITVGIAILDHHENINYPTYWHVRDYGLMAANPFGLSHFLGKKFDGSFVLTKGNTLTFKYRLIVHDEDTINAKIKENYLNYYLSHEYKIL